MHSRWQGLTLKQTVKLLSNVWKQTTFQFWTTAQTKVVQEIRRINSRWVLPVHGPIHADSDSFTSSILAYPFRYSDYSDRAQVGCSEGDRFTNLQMKGFGNDIRQQPGSKNHRKKTAVMHLLKNIENKIIYVERTIYYIFYTQKFSVEQIRRRNLRSGGYTQSTWNSLKDRRHYFCFRFLKIILIETNWT